MLGDSKEKKRIRAWNCRSHPPKFIQSLYWTEYKIKRLRYSFKYA